MSKAFLSVLVVAVALVPGCRSERTGERGAAAAKPKAAARPAGDYLVLVGGTPIREADVRYQRMAETHSPEVTPAQRTEILGELVDKELAARRAVELGLDQDRYYRERLSQLQAQVAAFKRNTLSDALMARELGEVKVDPAEVRSYYDAHAAELRQQLHLLQILDRDRAAIERDKAALAAGKSFEEVAVEAARRTSPHLIEDEGEAEEGGGALYDKVARPGAEKADQASGVESPKPFWDLGYLRWDQLPESWRTVVPALQPGQVSDVIEGTAGRYFLVKLVDRRDDPAQTFEAVEATLTQRLRQDKLRKRRAQLEAELRAATPVRYSDPALAPGASAKAN